MRISLIHPSKGRHKLAFEAFQNWSKKADNWKNIEYILSVDTPDAGLYMQEFYPFWHAVRILHLPNNSAIEAINNAAQIATGDIFIVMSDDFDCPEHWDTLLLEALEGKSDFIVKTQDGLQPTLITLPILDKVYYNRFGYVYHPDYLHLHSDEEMTIVGHMLGRVITLPLLFPHNHYTTGKMQMDAINEKNNSTWAHGQRTLDRRALNNFGIENPLIRREDIKWK